MFVQAGPELFGDACLVDIGLAVIEAILLLCPRYGGFVHKPFNYHFKDRFSVTGSFLHAGFFLCTLIRICHPCTQTRPPSIPDGLKLPVTIQISSLCLSATAFRPPRLISYSFQRSRSWRHMVLLELNKTAGRKPPGSRRRLGSTWTTNGNRLP